MGPRGHVVRILLPFKQAFDLTAPAGESKVLDFRAPRCYTRPTMPHKQARNKTQTKEPIISAFATCDELMSRYTDAALEQAEKAVARAVAHKPDRARTVLKRQKGRRPH